MFGRLGKLLVLQVEFTCTMHGQVRPTTSAYSDARILGYEVTIHVSSVAVPCYRILNVDICALIDKSSLFTSCREWELHYCQSHTRVLSRQSIAHDIWKNVD